MSIEEKIELNKRVRRYEGDNSFLVSVTKYLKTTKNFFLDSNGKKHKELSEKQYKAVSEMTF